MRFYNGLYEARESRDRLFRNEAQRIYKNLVDIFSKVSQEEINDMYQETRKFGDVGIFDYSKVEREYDLLFVLTTQEARTQGKVQFGLGHYKNEPVIFLPIVYTADPKTIKTNLETAKKTIIHELIHFLDEQRGALSKGSSVQKDVKGYFNDPSEFNAYYQETIDDVRDFLKKHGDNPQAIKLFKMDDTQGFIRAVKKRFMYREFIENLNKKYERKLDKRLADLCQELQKEGLI